MSATVSGPTYQETIASLERYWADHGCVLMQPYHTEVGAGTFTPATFLRCLGPEPWKVGYVEPSIRPSDGRYGENPFRFQHFFQYQVIVKPAPDDVLDVYFESLRAVGIDLEQHDVRLVEDDWEGPTLGAWGLGWEVWIVGTGGHLGGRLSRVRAPVVDLQLRGGAGGRARPALRRARARVPAPRRARPPAPRVRPGAQVLAHLQPARRARRALYDPACVLRCARARSRALRRAALPRFPCRACCLRSAARSSRPAPVGRRRSSCRCWRRASSARSRMPSS